MKLVVGLGNPGRRYAKTRHNLGYQAVDLLADRWGVSITQQKFNGLIGSATYAGHDVLLLKPTTFMNASGESVLAIRQFYKLPSEDLMVVLDDLDLPVGRVRVRAGGSAGGHRGLGDILRRLGTDQIARIRIGIGKTGKDQTVRHVLSRADEQEESQLAEAVATAADAVMCWIREGVEDAMNRFNGSDRPKRRAKAPERRRADESETRSEETSR